MTESIESAASNRDKSSCFYPGSSLCSLLRILMRRPQAKPFSFFFPELASEVAFLAVYQA